MLRQTMKSAGIRSMFLSFVFVLFAAGICAAQGPLYFPQFVDGSQSPASGAAWVTAIAVTNPAAGPEAIATGSITVTNADGSPMKITLTDENGKNPGNTFQLAGGQTQFFLSPQSSSPELLRFNIGYATVMSDLPINASSVLIEGNQKGMIGTAGVAGSVPLTRQEIIAIKNENSGIALAVANPGSDDATITFRLFDKSGVLIVPPVTRTLAANNQTALFLSDLFPTAPSGYFGTLSVISDNGIVTTGLLFQGTTFTAFPAIPLR